MRRVEVYSTPEVLAMTNSFPDDSLAYSLCYICANKWVYTEEGYYISQVSQREIEMVTEKREDKLSVKVFAWLDEEQEIIWKLKF